MDNNIHAADANSLRRKVFDEIEKNILNGVYPEGEQLIEGKLSVELNVSRTPVREALRQLELEGLVKLIPNKGAVVVGISKKDIEDIYEIRIVLEGMAGRLAARNITDEQIKKLEQIIELQEFYVSKDEYVEAWKLDSQFHQLVFRASGNRMLSHTLSDFHHYIQRARQLSFEAKGRSAHVVEEHRRILDAIRNRDEKAAEKLTSEHIKKAKENIALIEENI